MRHALTSKDQVSRVVRTAVQGRFNALLVQVRGRGDAYYRSQGEPQAEELPEEDLGFDPLAEIITQARSAGLEVHAWVNVYLAWHPTPRLPRSATHVLARHPEWFMVSADGIDMGQGDLEGIDLVKRGVEGRYLSPGVPEVRGYLLEVFEEILQRYDVDGIHLDYVRYPNIHYDYNLISRAEFSRRYHFDPLNLVATNTKRTVPVDLAQGRKVWEKWRTDQVTLLVEGVHRLIARVKPRVKLSAAVKPDVEVAYRQHGQDWIRWINQQMVDFVVPMFYTGSTEQIGVQMKTVQQYVKKGHLYAGIGAYNQSPLATVAQVEQVRRMGLKGIVLYSYDSLIEQPNALDLLREGLFETTSVVPKMMWKQGGKGAETKTR